MPFGDESETCLTEDEANWDDDPMGISIPWEEKNESKKKIKKNKSKK